MGMEKPAPRREPVLKSMAGGWAQGRTRASQCRKSLLPQFEADAEVVVAAGGFAFRTFVSNISRN